MVFPFTLGRFGNWSVFYVALDIKEGRKERLNSKELVLISLRILSDYPRTVKNIILKRPSELQSQHGMEISMRIRRYQQELCQNNTFLHHFTLEQLHVCVGVFFGGGSWGYGGFFFKNHYFLRCRSSPSEHLKRSPYGVQWGCVLKNDVHFQVQVPGRSLPPDLDRGADGCMGCTIRF